MKRHVHTLYLPKEQSSWSLKDGQVPHRYIQVLTLFSNEEVRDQTLELPEDEAYRLCTSMGNLDMLLSLIDPAEGAVLMYNNAVMTGTAWAMPGLVTMLQTMATSPQFKAPLDISRITIDVDMRGGTFIVKDLEGKECLLKVVEWIRKLYVK